MKLPVVLVQVASLAHVSVPSAHSSTSAHSTPLPVYPALQAQLKLPVVLLHVASLEHVSVPSAHSSTSLHSTPLRLDRCLAYAESEPLVEGKPPTCSIVEPLPQLIQAITRCMQAQQASNAAGAPPGADDADDDTSAKVLDGARHAGGC